MDAILFTLQLIFLLMLKPALIFLAPVFLVIWTYTLFLKGKRKNAIWGIAGTIIGSSCLLSYSLAYEKEYGIFSPSVVSTLNNYHIGRRNGLLKPGLIKDPGMRSDLEKSIEANGDCPEDLFLIFREAREMINAHSLPTVHAEVKACRRHSPVRTIKALFSRLYLSTEDPAFGSCLFKSKWAHLFSFHVSTLYLFLLLYSFLLARWIVSRRSIPWFTSLLYMIGISQIVISVVGAQSDWGRLLLPALPAYLLMIGQTCRQLRFERVDAYL